MRHRQGFTIIELILFSAIFSVITIAFITILISVTRVQVRQASANEVTQQSQFLLQTIQRYVEASSLVEMAADSPTSTLTLRMSTSSIDPTTIYLSGGVAYLREGSGGTPQALTTASVTVQNLTFTKRAHSTGGKDSVSVAANVEYATSNAQRRFVHGLSTSIARVSAATFDSNVLPSSNNLYKLGASSQIWQSVNDLLYFTSSNVGIGTASPSQKLDINGALRLSATSGKPTCDNNARGTFWVTLAGAGTADTAEVCLRVGTSSQTFAWTAI